MKYYLCQNVAKGRKIALCNDCIDKHVGESQNDEVWQKCLVEINWKETPEIRCEICQRIFYRFAFDSNGKIDV